MGKDLTHSFVRSCFECWLKNIQEGKRQVWGHTMMPTTH